VCLVLMLACVHTTDLPAHTQEYPTKPVRLVEPFGAGGGVDVVARPVAQKLSELWGQPVIVENHPGAGATAAPALVAKSPADGYTLLVNTSAQAYSASISKNLPYDPLNDFIPIAPITSQSYVLVAGKSLDVRTVSELVLLAKKRPNQLTFGSTGIGTGTHLAAEKFNRSTGITAAHVPAKPNEGVAEVLAHTVSADTDYMVAPIPYALADIRKGNLRALGVTGAKRSALLPEVPTISEGGVTGFDFPIWYGVWAPKGTPSGVVDRIAGDIRRALSSPDLRDWLVAHGSEPLRMTQTEFARFVRSESQKARLIVKQTVK
jgi:tripartite-type tricarboxylate transporter receptor subunit TctC